MLIGFFHPTLFLPQTEIDNEQMRHIITHELVHYRRHDLEYKWFAMAVCSLHWFNPLAYIISRQIDEACEISCDYAVTKNLTPSERTAYMRSILQLISSACRRRPLTTQMASDKKTLTRRFTMIKSIKKRSKALTFISILITLLLVSTTALASGLAQNAARDDYDITIYKGGEELTLTHKPFIANNTLYLPLREMLNLEGIDDKDITYTDGIVEFLIPAEGGTEYRGVRYNNWINRVSIKSQFGYLLGHSHGSTENTTFIAPSLLREGAVYVPYDVITKLGNSGENIFTSVYAEAKAKNSALPPLDGTIYTNDNFDYNFSLRLPLEWCGKFMVEEEENSDNHRVYFYQKNAERTASNPKNGLLFYVQIADGLHHSASGDFVMQANDKTYSFVCPTAEEIKQYDNISEKEYKELSALIDPYITRSIDIIVNYAPLDISQDENVHIGIYDVAKAYTPTNTQ